LATLVLFPDAPDAPLRFSVPIFGVAALLLLLVLLALLGVLCACFFPARLAYIYIYKNG